jgi:large subunit ribosomal protein L4e
MIMQANVYQIDGKVEKKITLPKVFEKSYNEGIVRRALLSEQSTRYQPQGHYLMAGLQTTATYVGRYSTYRTLRHVGQAIRPRQKLAKGAMGDVRRIPSSVKGRRAHPHKIEKTIVERINRKEYVLALESAIAGTANAKVVKQNHTYSGETLPIVVSSQIEKLGKTSDLLKVLEALSLMADVEKSHDPKIKPGLRRKVQRRYFRNSVLIVAKDATTLSRSGRNIPGVAVSSVSALDIETLAPGANPRLTVWSEAAIPELEASVSKAKPKCAA